MGLKIIDKTYKLLKDNPGRKFTAREIAEWIFTNYPKECEKKKQNRAATIKVLETDADMIQQLTAEIGSSRPRLQEKYPTIKNTEGRPKSYYYSTESDEEEVNRIEEEGGPKYPTAPINSTLTPIETRIFEKDLYVILSDYLYNEQDVFSKRIAERGVINGYTLTWWECKNFRRVGMT